MPIAATRFCGGPVFAFAGIARSGRGGVLFSCGIVTSASRDAFVGTSFESVMFDEGAYIEPCACFSAACFLASDLNLAIVGSHGLRK